MEFKDTFIIVSTDPRDLLDESRSRYVAHILCDKGQCVFTFREKDVLLTEGNSMISFIENFVDCEPSPDCRLRIICTHPEFHMQCIPQNNYGMQGGLNLYLNPIISLNEEEYHNLSVDFDQILYRLQAESPFKIDVMINVVQLMFLDFYLPHSRVISDLHLGAQTTAYMIRFIRLLHTGAYKEHRDVAWYASELCITPKYLSEVSVKASAQPASYWIIRFISVDILSRLKRHSATLTDIADEFHFSTMGNFTRFVRQHLGFNPSDYYN